MILMKCTNKYVQEVVTILHLFLQQSLNNFEVIKYLQDNTVDMVPSNWLKLMQEVFPFTVWSCARAD